MVSALEGIVAPAAHEWTRLGLPEEPLRLAAMRILLRLVVIRRAEGTGLLPCDDPLYGPSYSLSGLHRRLRGERLAGEGSLAGRGHAWPRVQALFQLVWAGSDHPALPIRAYGGELFEPGRTGSDSPVLQALALLRVNGPDDAGVLEVLDRLGECERLAGGPEAPAARLVGTLYEELLEWRLELESGEPRAVNDRSRRKGTGSFYTPPELARDLVRRTLDPLLVDVKNHLRPPEELLSLRVCDPAMGSGSFLSAALEHLSEAVVRSAQQHGRLRAAHSGRESSAATLVDLGRDIRLELPGAADDPLLEESLRVRVRRLVVENCLWGVDLDPVAVELARTALWLETLDRRLPLTFLDHKLVSGDALVGCWLSDLPVYPLSAWRHEPAAPQVNAEARSVLLAKTSPLLPLSGSGRPESVRRRLSGCLDELRAIPIEFPDRKRAGYRARVLGDSEAVALKGQMDRWCALWFTQGGPGPERPGPRLWYSCPDAGMEPAARAASTRRFLHWELVFPDVFEGEFPGFDALLGNPPWEVLRSRPDRFLLSRWFSGRACPGGPLDARYRALSRKTGDPCAADAEARSAPFVEQGASDHNTYRLFLEQAWHLIRAGGRLGFLVPGGIASDRGAAPLRRLFLDQGEWEQLISFDNRRRLFPVDGRLKFCAVVVRKGGRTERVHASFGNETPVPAEGVAWSRELIEDHSAQLAFPELSGGEEIALFTALHRAGIPLVRWRPSTRAASYARELDAGNGEGLFAPVPDWLARGAVPYLPEPGEPAADHQAAGFPAALDLWKDRDGLLLPVVHGALVLPHGLSNPDPREGISPRDLMPLDRYFRGRGRGLKVAVRRVTNATNTRTLIAGLVPDLPCTDKAAVLTLPAVEEMLLLLALLNSFPLDFVARRICAGTNLDRHHLMRLPMPSLSNLGRISSLADHPPDPPCQSLGSGSIGVRLARNALRLGACHPLFAPLWVRCAESWPELLQRPWHAWWAVTPATRTALKVENDLLAASACGLGPEALDLMLEECGHPSERLADPAFAATLDRRGFWRVDRERPPEARHTELVRTLSRPAGRRFPAEGSGGSADTALPATGRSPAGRPPSESATTSVPAAPGWEQTLVPHLGPLLAPWQEGLDAADNWKLCRETAGRLAELGFRLLPGRTGLL